MSHEGFNPKETNSSLLQHVLRNGDTVSQEQFTELILQQAGISDLTLLTMAYMTPKKEGSSVVRIHNHLLQLADQGTRVHVGIDNSYARLIAPHTDFPNVLAPFFIDRKELRIEELKRAKMYDDLASHPNIELVYHGEGNRKLLPFLRLDHRKILHVKGSPIQNFAVIYGFNMDKTLDEHVDSGTYITDPSAIDWIDAQRTKGQDCPAESATFGDFVFITREMTKGGNTLADQELGDVVHNAEKDLLFCSQYIPEGLLLKDLTDAADRGVEVTIISSNPAPSRQPLYMPTRIFAERKLARACRIRKNIQFYVPQDENGFIHMKALITDISQPAKAKAITGTDNMSSEMLRRFKTREILIKLLNYGHMYKLYEYIEDNIFPDVKRVRF